jgi:hypothetical protein
MKRFFASALVLSTFCACLLLLLPSRRVAAADDGILSADRTVTQAFEKGDKAAVQKWVDPEFTWIDTDGIMWPLRETLEAHVKPLVPSSGDLKVIEHKYGNVVWVQTNEGKNYAAHTWVKRANGWKLLNTSEIAVHDRDYTPVRPTYDIPCINPCAYAPFKPLTENEKSALAGWQEQESGKPGMWAKHIADNLDQRAVSSAGGPRVPKADIVAAQEKAAQQAAQNPNRPEVATVPFLWSRWWDLGDAVVMISVQPTYGERAYWASRVFAPLNGTWMMMESYHIEIASSPVMTAAPLDQSKDAKGLPLLRKKATD